MPVKDPEPIKANENERQALQKIEEVLNRKPLLSQPDNTSLPRLVGPNNETLACLPHFCRQAFVLFLKHLIQV